MGIDLEIYLLAWHLEGWVVLSGEIIKKRNRIRLFLVEVGKCSKTTRAAGMRVGRALGVDVRRGERKDWGGDGAGLATLLAANDDRRNFRIFFISLIKKKHGVTFFVTRCFFSFSQNIVPFIAELSMMQEKGRGVWGDGASCMMRKITVKNNLKIKLNIS
ncbi:MAG: hypothetical protein ACOY90_00855 [Candidatus Zhuqueibacterota bacterium]